MWARFGSPGPKLTAGTPSAENRATSVQPSLASTGRPSASTNAGPRAGAARAGPRGAVDDVDVVAGEDLAHVVLGLVLRQRGGEAVVDGDDALVRDDVARDAAADEDRVERLAVLQPVDDRVPARRRPAARARRRRRGSRCAPSTAGPSARRCPGRHLGAQGALAAALDAPVGGLEQHGEVGSASQSGRCARRGAARCAPRRSPRRRRRRR